MRGWLDRHGIDLVGVIPPPVKRGITAFDVYFQSEDVVLLH